MSIDKSRKAMAEERLAAVRAAREMNTVDKIRKEIADSDAHIANIERLYTFEVTFCSRDKLWRYEMRLSRLERNIKTPTLTWTSFRAIVEPAFLELLAADDSLEYQDRIDQQVRFQQDVREMFQWTM